MSGTSFFVFKGEQHVKSNFQAQLRHHCRYLELQFGKKKLNHSSTVLQLKKIHKYYENFWRQFGKKSGGSSGAGGRGGRAFVNFEGIFSFYGF